MTKAKIKYDPDSLYQASVKVPVKIGPFKYLPRDDLRIKGSMLNRIVEENGDAIRTANKI